MHSFYLAHSRGTVELLILFLNNLIIFVGYLIKQNKNYKMLIKV